jgi:hypothetical protein
LRRLAGCDTGCGLGLPQAPPGQRPRHPTNHAVHIDACTKRGRSRASVKEGVSARGFAIDDAGDPRPRLAGAAQRKRGGGLSAGSHSRQRSKRGAGPPDHAIDRAGRGGVVGNGESILRIGQTTRQINQRAPDPQRVGFVISAIGATATRLIPGEAIMPFVTVIWSG